MTSLVFFMLLGYSTLVSSQNNNASQGNKNIFILAGQSNMAGRGGRLNNAWDGIVPPECQSNPQILRLNAGLTWEEAHEPLHVDIDVTKVCGIGPGMPFANSVLEKDSSIGVIGLVPCAIGGTKLSQWSRGTTLYNQMLNRARAALRDGGVIRALLWYQGESDTENLEDAQSYKPRFEQFINDVRSDLQSPMLPVIQVALASGDGNFTKEVRKCQLEVNLPNLRTIDAMGLQLQYDHVHLTTEAEIQVGQMFADAFLQFPATLPNSSSAPPRPKRLDKLFSGLLL